MTGSKWALTPPFTGIVARDVVAGLLGRDSVHSVSRAAVQVAASHGARVRFVHVVPAGMSAQERDDTDNLGFAAALRALREFPRVPVTFEVAEGEPGPVLVERAADAGTLVIAAGEGYADQASASGPAGSEPGTGANPDGGPHRAVPDPELNAAQQLATYCQRHAHCDVLTVRSSRAARTGLASTA